MKRPDWAESKTQQESEIVLVDLRTGGKSALATEVSKQEPTINAITRDVALKLDALSDIKVMAFLTGNEYDQKINKMLDKIPDAERDSLIHMTLRTDGDKDDVNKYVMYVGRDPKPVFKMDSTGGTQSLETAAKNISGQLTSAAEQAEEIVRQASTLKR